MAYIQFTDATGTAVVAGAAPVAARPLAGRFCNWTPKTRPVGDAATAIGTGARFMFRNRTDYGASFELRGISAHYSPTYGLHPNEAADRLVAHLLNGGTCQLATEDNAGTVYATVGLWPDAEPELELSDPKALEYTLRLAVVRLDGVAAPLVCRYGRLT